MTNHDPMCPNTHSLVVADDTPCQCDLIARVREDERISWGEHLARTQITNVDLANESAAKYLEGRKDALAEAREAVAAFLVGDTDCDWTYSRCLAAIDALRGGTDE
jgi:hypothetical protein